MEMQPMETAPRDGTIFLAFYKSNFGPSFGPMSFDVSGNKDDKTHDKNGNFILNKFFSWGILTESNKAIGWVDIDSIIHQ